MADSFTKEKNPTSNLFSDSNQEREHGAVSNLNYQLNHIETRKMTQEANQMEVPNLAATSDGKRIFTPEQWLERFRQYTKMKYRIDLTEIIRGAEMTHNGWTDEKVKYKKLSNGA